MTTWSYAQRSTAYTYWEKQNNFKIIVPNNLYGSAIRLKYSNVYNSKVVPIKCVRLQILDSEGDELKQFIVSKNCNLPFGQDAYSNVVEMNVTPGMRLKVDMCFATYDNPLTGNTFDGYLAMVLQSIEILTREKVSVLACFGDSLTHHGMWTTPLFQHLYNEFPGKIAGFEVGINGNRLLQDSLDYQNTLGISGVKRFNHDILELFGLTHVIIALGINDIGLPGTEKTSISEFPELEDMKRAYEDMALELRNMGIKAIAATITPRNWNCSYIQRRENLRLKFNDWILNTNVFDKVFDFSSVLAEDGRSGLKRTYDSGDGIHITDVGGKKLQEAINIDCFINN